MRLKLGLLTIDRFEYNYGTSLQQYATIQLFNQLFKECGINANIEIIDYVYSLRIQKYTSEHRKSIFNNARKQLAEYGTIILDDVSASYFNRHRFYEFDNKYLKVSKKQYNENSNLYGLNFIYDFLLLGSDQTLNPHAYSLQDSFYNMEYFLNKNKILSYAPSMGVSEYPEEVKNRYLKTLKNIKFLSGREVGQCELVNNMLGENKMQLVLDPTLLLQSEHYEYLEKKVPLPDKYILVISYGGLSDDKIDFVNQYAKEKNLEIIQISNFVNKNWKFLRTGPAEFLYLIHNADLVFTDAYHGALFSLIYEKNFIYFERENIRTREDGTMWFSRFESLEKILNIRSAKYIKDKPLNEYILPDYKKINPLIEQYKHISMDFIREELKYMKAYKPSLSETIEVLSQSLCKCIQIEYNKFLNKVLKKWDFLKLKFEPFINYASRKIKRIFAIYMIIKIQGE